MDNYIDSLLNDMDPETFFVSVTKMNPAVALSMMTIHDKLAEKFNTFSEKYPEAFERVKNRNYSEWLVQNELTIQQSAMTVDGCLDQLMTFQEKLIGVLTALVDEDYTMIHRKELLEAREEFERRIALFDEQLIKLRKLRGDK